MFQKKHFNLLLLPLYWIAVVCLYHKGHTGALVDDGNAGLVDFKIEGWKGMSNNYGMTSLYYFHDLVSNLWFELFGANTKVWFLLTATLHALNSWLIFINMKTFYQRCNLKHGEMIALFGSLMFLLSPYQSENVIWAATHHYGFALFLFMLMFKLLMNLRDDNAISSSLLLTLLFIISLITFEETLVFPGVLVVFFLLLKMFSLRTVATSKFLLLSILPQALLILLYFTLTKIIKGNFVPHYGETHLENLSIDVYAATFLQYIFKHLGFIHFGDYGFREKIYDFIAERTILVVVSFIAFLSILTSVVALRIGKRALIIVGLLIISVMFLLPSLNLYFMYLFRLENDRLGYFGSVALYQIVPFVFFSILPYLGYLVSVVYLIVSVYLITMVVPCWRAAGEMYINCVNTLPKKEGRIFFLNVPLKYQEVYVFRKTKRLSDVYQLYHSIQNSERLKPIAWTQFHSENDTIQIERISENSVKVYLQMTGSSWWMWNELGASDYENSDCVFDVSDDGMSYTLAIKNKKIDDSFWITTKSGFHEYKL